MPTHPFVDRLPDLPDDVAEQWLAPHLGRPGFAWPPEGPDGPWSTILAGRGVEWWAERVWHREALPIDLGTCAATTRAQVEALLADAERGVDRLRDSRDRLARLAGIIEATGTWPRAPVAYPHVDGLGLVDGHHRLAALERVRRAKGPEAADSRHDLWIALPP